MISMLRGEKTKVLDETSISNTTGMGVLEDKTYNDMNEEQMMERMKKQLERMKGMPSEVIQNFEVPNHI